MEEIRPPHGQLEGPADFEDLPEGDGVLILSPERQILSASLQAERLLRRELRRGQILPLAGLFSEASLTQVETAFGEALKEGISCANLMGEVIHPQSGQSFFLNYTVSPLYNQKERIIGVILVLRDSTLSRAWSDWSRSDLGQECDALLENLAEAVFTINTGWRITGFNQRAQEITGFKRQEVLGRPCWEVFKADRCQTNCPLRATMEDGVTRTDQDVRIVHKKGRPLTILVNTAVIKDKRGLIAGAVETFQPLAPLQPEEAEGEPARPLVAIIGQSPAMRGLLALLPDIARSEASVVLEGESGTGKDLFARALHFQSPRAQGPFVAFNCSAFVETLLESELFGHVKGAFTGAISGKVGRFELAKGGTLFLDEIGDLKPELQTKLLRVLEERVFERVGSNRPIPLEARVIAATSRNLVQEVRKGRFRMDLLYRLRTVPLYLPPLRERREDIALLVNHFVSQLNQKYRKDVRGVDPKVIALFQQYSWPGNVRELERVLEYAFVFVKGPIITRSHLPELETPKRRVESPGEAPAPDSLLWEDERLAIQKALEKARGRRKAAAQILGISRSSLWRKMKAHGLEKPLPNLSV